MSALLIRSIAAAEFEGHYRLGQFWPRAGRVVAEDAFTADEWAVLTADPRLHIGPAPDEAQVEAKVDSLKARVRAAISQLEPGDFDADGQPKLGAVKERLPDEAKKVTGKLVAEVWAEIARPT
ncbi:MAG: hypothetical protein IOD00_09595 [Rhodobacter sp.]|nr:hypothetical protein [Rhodobacter sp.]